MTSVNKTEDAIMQDRLREIFQNQNALQERMGQPMGEGEEAVRENMLALISEVAEVLGEINWKRWKTEKKEIDMDKLLVELTDILQFWTNAVQAMGFDSEDVIMALRGKWAINHDRIDDGECVEAS